MGRRVLTGSAVIGAAIVVIARDTFTWLYEKLLGWLIPDKWESQMIPSAPTLFGILLALFGLGILAWPLIRKSVWGFPVIPTQLTLDYRVGRADPILVSEENIDRFYNLNHITELQNPSGQVQTLVTTTLFVTFREGTTYKQVIVDGHSVQLPQFEVKDSAMRHVIIVFRDPPSGRMTVRLLQ